MVPRVDQHNSKRVFAPINIKDIIVDSSDSDDFGKRKVGTIHPSDILPSDSSSDSSDQHRQIQQDDIWDHPSGDSFVPRDPSSDEKDERSSSEKTVNKFIRCSCTPFFNIPINYTF
jgi:hypothetical protein